MYLGLSTGKLLRQLMHYRFAVALTVANVRRSLQNLGFSAQWPLYWAEQADPAAVARWREVEYPKIAAGARAVGDPELAYISPAV
jgi:Winged helix-turn helix